MVCNRITSHSKKGGARAPLALPSSTCSLLTKAMVGLAPTIRDTMPVTRVFATAHYHTKNRHFQQPLM